MSSLAGAAQRFGLPHWKTRKVSLRLSRPVISFTFDDFPRSALTNGGTILARYNLRGTYYAAMGLMGISNHQGEHFYVRDLRALLADGHELGSHTYSHLSAAATPLDRFCADIARGESEVAALRGNPAEGNFAYPFGQATFACKGVVGSQMRSCRGIRGGINAPFADLNLLKANRIYSKDFNLAAVQSLIQENQRIRGWLIFYTHDVRENPSEYGCTPEQLESVVRAASQIGATILPVGQAIAAIQPA